MPCRICRTSKNLKYSSNDFARRKKAFSTKIINDRDTTLGNICWDCEERLLNFDKFSEAKFDPNAESESPVIVDDDELLYSSFFNRKVKPVREKSKFVNNEAFETIEVLTSRENTPEQSLVSPLLIIDLECEDEYVGDKLTLEAKSIGTNVIESIDVSSDSEVEISSTNYTTKINIKSRSHSRSNLYSSFLCDREIPTEYSFKQHSRNLVNCPKCPVIFTCSLKLVRHIRTQHRTYSGNILSERPKYMHDSAMTIRLKYMSRQSYYECNLCGQIDLKYSIHRQHVVDKHAEESKRLDDSFPLEIKCPICFDKCKSNVELCRHLRQVHRKSCNLFLKISRPSKIYGFSLKKQNLLKETARVYQMFDRPNRYYECNMCGNICTSYSNHRRHLQTHGYNNEKRKNDLNMLQTTESDRKSKKLADSSMNNKRKRALENLKKKQCTVYQKTSDNLKKKTRISDKTKYHQFVKSLRTIPERSTKSENNIALKLKTTRSIRKQSERILKKTINQKYFCKFCYSWFVGYSRLNLHLIYFHSAHDYHKCIECARNFVSQAVLDYHRKTVHSRRQLCQECGLEFSTHEGLKWHKHFSHRRKFKIDKTKQFSVSSGCQKKMLFTSTLKSVLY